MNIWYGFVSAIWFKGMLDTFIFFKLVLTSQLPFLNLDFSLQSLKYKKKKKKVTGFAET